MIQNTIMINIFNVNFNNDRSQIIIHGLHLQFVGLSKLLKVIKQMTNFVVLRVIIILLLLPITGTLYFACEYHCTF